jgi:hypothetical protein
MDQEKIERNKIPEEMESIRKKAYLLIDSAMNQFHRETGFFITGINITTHKSSGEIDKVLITKIDFGKGMIRVYG